MGVLTEQDNHMSNEPITTKQIRQQMLNKVGKGWEPFGELSIENETLNVRARWLPILNRYEATAFIGHSSSVSTIAETVQDAVSEAIKERRIHAQESMTP
jgi:hypothetical protein